MSNKIQLMEATKRVSNQYVNLKNYVPVVTEGAVVQNKNKKLVLVI